MPELMPAELPNLIALLQGHPAFAHLSPEKIAEFAQKATIKLYRRDEMVIQQGERDDHFFIIIDGQLRAFDPTQPPGKDLLNYHVANDIIGTRPLLNEDGRPRAATVNAETDAIIAVYDRTGWNSLLAEYPGFRSYCEHQEHTFEQRAQFPFPGRQEGEVVIASAKRHVIAFIAKLVWPLSLLIIAVLYLLVDELFGITFVSAIQENRWLTLISIGLPLILAILLTIYFYLDWRNDDFIVTTKRVIHIERVLLYRIERHEAPLTRIQNVTIKSHNLLEQLLDVYDIEIKTAGVGVVAFSYVPAADVLSQIILREQARAKARVAAADVGSVRRLVTQRISQTTAITGGKTDVTAPPLPSRRLLPKMPKPHPRYFWPIVKEKTIIKSGEKSESAIIWRKHYYILLKHIIVPMLLVIILLYVLVGSVFALPPFGVLGTFTRLLLGLIFLGCLFWTLWEYDGWRRDIYIVTESRIIDVESSPFRTRGEKQREGDFDSIQNITYEIPNFFYTLLNLGDVVIETAAGAGKFTFQKVYNPSSVQEEIFDRWDTFQRRKQEKTRDNTNQQIMTVLGEYHTLTSPEKPAA